MGVAAIDHYTVLTNDLEATKRFYCDFLGLKDGPRPPFTFPGAWLYAAGKIELELVPQGTLSERMRAAGAGIGGFYTPTGYGTDLAKGKETRVINGRNQVLEMPIKGDVALVKAERADRWGNLVYRLAARNFGPTMAMAADCTVVQVREIVELGEIDPDQVMTPGIFVDRVIAVPNPEPAGQA